VFESARLSLVCLQPARVWLTAGAGSLLADRSRALCRADPVVSQLGAVKPVAYPLQRSLVRAIEWRSYAGCRRS
jgi:hypothetical protein